MQSTSNPSANDRQVGGAHYKGVSYQHWDFSTDVRLLGLQHVATRYLDRHGRKNGAEDLDKAIHTVQKMRECAVEGRLLPIDWSPTEDEFLLRYLATRPFTKEECSTMSLICCWRSTEHIDAALSRLAIIRSAAYPDLAGA